MAPASPRRVLRNQVGIPPSPPGDGTKFLPRRTRRAQEGEACLAVSTGT
jgi:hypothetical protein